MRDASALCAGSHYYMMESAFMSKKITLNDIRESVEKKFGSLEIDLGAGDVVKLLNPMRLSDAKRERLSELVKSDEDGDGETRDETSAEVRARLANIISACAEDEDAAAKLVSIIGDDTAMLSEIVTSMFEDLQSGEASPSHD